MAKEFETSTTATEAEKTANATRKTALKAFKQQQLKVRNNRDFEKKLVDILRLLEIPNLSTSRLNLKII